jgi:hypothetical protein
MGMITVMHLHSASEGKTSPFTYRGMYRYLITLSTLHSKRLFTALPNAVKVLDVLRECAWDHHFDVVGYSFLPESLRLLIQGKTEESDMRALLSAFRSKSSAALEAEVGHALWKPRYLERVLRKKDDTTLVLRDLFQTPVRLGLVQSVEQYQLHGSFLGDIASLTARPERVRRTRVRPARRPRGPR